MRIYFASISQETSRDIFMNRVRVYGGWVQIFRVKMMREELFKDTSMD